MRLPDTLPDLAGELRALPAKQRQAILGSLTPAERSRMMALLNRPKAGPEPAAPSAEPAIEGLSPWLAQRVRQAQGSGEGGAQHGMTPATRQLLVKAAAATLASGGHRESAAAAAVPAGRSLLGAVGDRLVQRRAQR